MLNESDRLPTTHAKVAQINRGGGAYDDPRLNRQNRDLYLAGFAAVERRPVNL